jgi:RNA polymerase sigma factor (sigma-70 family)
MGTKGRSSFTSEGNAAMRDDPVVAALVARAAGHDEDAWNQLVERYSPMVWAICVRYRLSSHDTEDVNQSVWLRLVEQLGNLREPAALPGWLATTTSRECLRVLRMGRRDDRFGPAPDELPPSLDAALIEEEIIAAERNAALRAAFAELPAHCRQLLAMLIADPPHSYAEISLILGMRQGSIGPQRARCLDRLRRSSSLRAFLDAETSDKSVECSGGEPRA